MKKRDLKKLALLGIAGGAIVASQGALKAETEGDDSSNSNYLSGLIAAGCGQRPGGVTHSCGQNPGNHSCGQRPDNHSCGNQSRDYLADSDDSTRSSSGQMMTEDQLMSQLNEHGKQMYRGMNPEGKALAIKLASRSCKNTNDCKGENSCKTDKNSCAGQGACAAMSKCSFKDKNLAVKVAAQKQAQKRAQTSMGTYSPTNSGSY